MNSSTRLPDASLADVLPAVSVLYGSATSAAANPPASGELLRLTPHRDVVVLLIDGLGAELLTEHAELAPTAATMTRTVLRAGFPATTATSLTSLSVGAPCGVHGIIGYSFLADGPSDSRRVLNALRWTLDNADGPSGVGAFPPQSVQPVRSRLEQFAADGVEIHYVTPNYQRDSPLTRAAFRAPGAHHPAADCDAVRRGVLEAVCRPGPGRRFVYAYYGDLDLNGHLHGPGSPEWKAQLSAVNQLIEQLADDLPDDCLLLVTGDHGMVAAGAAVDIDTTAALRASVAAVAGEARVRHVYAEPGAASTVLAAWRETLGDRALVVSREQAIDDGWFGARLSAPAAARIGDVVAVASGSTILTRSVHEPVESAMAGHHGAFTTAEQLVPLISPSPCYSR